jgi:hypothetical protein
MIKKMVDLPLGPAAEGQVARYSGHAPGEPVNTNYRCLRSFARDS